MTIAKTEAEVKAAWQVEYEGRKFARMWREAAKADQVRHMTAVTKDGVVCTMVIKRALRSRGYQSNYEATPKYWQFLWKDGKAAYARTLNSTKLYNELLETAVACGWKDTVNQ